MASAPAFLPAAPLGPPRRRPFRLAAAATCPCPCPCAPPTAPPSASLSRATPPAPQSPPPPLPSPPSRAHPPAAATAAAAAAALPRAHNLLSSSVAHLLPAFLSTRAAPLPLPLPIPFLPLSLSPLLFTLRAALAQQPDADVAADALADAADAAADVAEAVRDDSLLSRVLAVTTFALLIYATLGTIVLAVGRFIANRNDKRERQLVQDWLDGKDVPMGIWAPKDGDEYKLPADLPYKPKSGAGAGVSGNRELRRQADKKMARKRKKNTDKRNSRSTSAKSSAADDAKKK